MGLFKSKTRSVVGLDIEPGFVAAAEFSQNGKPVLVNAATTSLGPGLFHEGEVVDVDGLSDRLKSFFKQHDLPKRVRLGVASSKIAVRVLELPAIDDSQELDAAIRFQAQEELPMPLEQAVLDHRLLERIEDGEGGRMRILVVAARRDSVEHLLAAARRAGLQPELVDLSAFAMIRALYLPRRPLGQFAEQAEAAAFGQPAVARAPALAPAEAPALSAAAALADAPDAAPADAPDAAPADAPFAPASADAPLPLDALPAAVETEPDDEFDPAAHLGALAHLDDDALGVDMEARLPDEPDPEPRFDLDAPVPEDTEAHSPDDPDAHSPDDPDAALPDEVDAHLPDEVDAALPDEVDAALPDEVDAHPEEPDAQGFDFVVEPDAEAEAAEAEAAGVLYCYVGGLTNLAIAVGESCYFTRVLQNGMESMAATLAERRGLTLDHAREWLRYVGLERSLDRIEGDAEIVQVAREVLDSAARRISDEIRLSIEYYHSTVPNAHHVEAAVLAGPVITIAGFAGLLEVELGLPVESRSMGQIEVRPGALDGVDGAHLTVATGLALDEVVQ